MVTGSLEGVSGYGELGQRAAALGPPKQNTFTALRTGMLNIRRPIII